MYDFENMDKRLIAYVNIFILAKKCISSRSVPEG